METLLRLSGAAETENRFTPFRRSFLSRYSDREIPLVEALCDEIGIGFDSSSAPAADASPLLAFLALPGPDPPPAVALRPARELVYRKLGDVLADRRTRTADRTGVTHLLWIRFSQPTQVVIRPAMKPSRETAQ